MIECHRTLEQARRDCQAGRLTGALLLRVPMSRSEWTIRLFGAKGDTGMLRAVPSLETWVFTSLDSAVDTLEQIGLSFTQLKIQ